VALAALLQNVWRVPVGLVEIALFVATKAPASKPQPSFPAQSMTLRAFNRARRMLLKELEPLWRVISHEKADLGLTVFPSQRQAVPA
jgi:hypothetical protein